MHHLELKIPPAALVLLFAWAMWCVAEVSPWAVVQIPGKVLVASVLWGAGVVLIIIGAVAFISAKTTVNPLMPELTTSIVTRGIYKLSRNPMYVGFFMILVAWAVFLGNILSTVLLPLFVVYMNQFQITPEENALLAKFGDEYARYLKSVRRWI